MTQQVALVEAELLTLLEQRFAAEMTLLCSIPGIGRKTAGMLLLFAGGFTRFDNYRQVIALAGLSPREHTSGTSIRGKVRITKMGGGLIRGKLFMCSFSAKKTNAACAALFDRLVAKGKNKKLALLPSATGCPSKPSLSSNRGYPTKPILAQNSPPSLTF